MNEQIKPIEIFRIGNHTDMSGKQWSFTNADLQALVDAYQPEAHEAPLVVGHPEHDQPAYGWVESLSLSAQGVLLAQPNQVDPTFKDMVANGRFKKISASFYTPDAPSNPKPGSYYLRHVGFLGAQPPAVKGLKNAAFQENSEGVPCFAVFATPDIQEDSTVTAEELAAQAAELQKKEAAIATLEAAFAERESLLAKKETDQRAQECAEFAEKLVAKGQILPRQKDHVVGVLMELSVLPQTLSFTDAGGTTTQKTPVKALRDILSELPPQVDFGEKAAAVPAESHVSFSTADGYTVDPAGLVLYRAILDHARANNVSFVEAVATFNG